MSIFSKVPTIEWKDLRDNSLLIDIRRKEDYEEFHAPNFINLNIDEIMNYEGDKDKTIYITCYRGNSSKQATKILIEKGYDAYSIKGGMTEYKG